MTNLPEQIVASNVTAIAAGYVPQPVSQERRQSVGHGHNSYGQLGDGTLNNTNQPGEIVASNVMAIAAGKPQPVSQERRQSVGMGYNGYGQLGDNLLDNTRPSPSRCWRVTIKSPSSF